jgi:hypothetical protein
MTVEEFLIEIERRDVTDQIRPDLAETELPDLDMTDFFSLADLLELHRRELIDMIYESI